MRTIAIVLCDNDFLNTFPPLLRTVYEAIKEWETGEGEELSEENVKELIMSGVEFFYRGFQLGSRKNHDLDIPDTVAYLRGTRDKRDKGIRILFDSEAEKHIAESDHDGGSWYLELLTGRVYGY